MQPHHGGNLVWAAALANCPQRSILDFSASINPLGPSAAVLTALRQADLSFLTAYPDPNYGSLCRLLAERHGLDSDWVLPGNGSAELLTWAARDLAAQSAVLLPTPAFSDYQRALVSFDAQVLLQSLPLQLIRLRAQNNFEQAPGAVTPLPLPLDLSALPYPAQDCGLLINSPHNPTGQLWQRQSLRPYLDAFGLVVVDEAFMDFLPLSQQETVVDWVADFPNLAVLRSLTKFHSLPGLRLGYAIAHPDRLRRWQAWRDPWPINSLAILAAETTLADTAFEQATWDWLPPARHALLTGLAALPGLAPLPAAANFLLVSYTGSVTALQKQLLQQHQILIRDCNSFPELGDRAFRVAVRTPAENQRLLGALTQVLGAI
jgi:L-threonine-O-3-phosphate decarboxylase